MLGIVVTAYNPYYFNFHNILLSDLDKDNYNPVFISTWENQNFINEIGSNINFPLYYLEENPGKHDGTFYMVASTIECFKNCDYVLHFHADNWFRDGSKIISDTYEYVKKHNIKIAGLPRQWLFDENLVVNDKTIPFHFDFCMMEIELFNNIFDVTKLNQYKQLSLENGHPSMEWEPCMYHALEMNGIDINKDIYYVDSIEDLKKEHGNDPVYYNFFFKKSGIFHYDEKALLNKAKKDDVHWHWEDEDGNAIRKLTQEEIDKHI